MADTESFSAHRHGICRLVYRSSDSRAIAVETSVWDAAQTAVLARSGNGWSCVGVVCSDPESVADLEPIGTLILVPDGSWGYVALGDTPVGCTDVGTIYAAPLLSGSADNDKDIEVKPAHAPSDEASSSSDADAARNNATVVSSIIRTMTRRTTNPPSRGR